MKRLRTIDREARHAGSWHLAMSIACPECGGRLRGDMVYAWCEAWFCTWFCGWESLNDVAMKYNRANISDYLQANNFCLKDPMICPLAVNAK